MQIIRRTATVENVFVGDGYYTLSLKIGQLEDLQDILSSGPYEIVARLQGGTWRVRDIRETLRLGLIGGGMHPRRALDLVTSSVVEGYLLEYVITARAILQAALLGPEEEPVGSGEPKATPEPTEPPSTGATSTASAVRPGSRRKKSAG